VASRRVRTRRSYREGDADVRRLTQTSSLGRPASTVEGVRGVPNGRRSTPEARDQRFETHLAKHTMRTHTEEFG